MLTNISRFKLKSDREKIKLLVGAIILLWVLISLLDIFTNFSFASFAKAFIVSTVLVGTYRSLENYNYTFWSMGSILIFFALYGIWTNLFLGGTGPVFLYFLVLLLTSILGYVLFSPIYYPLVSWWEYDFRYRHDLKIKVTRFEGGKEKEIEGRLTDFRRDAAGICCFEKLNTGEFVRIEFEGEFHAHKFEGEIMSRRFYLIGRPIVYGVKLTFEGDHLRQEYEEFSSFWKRSKMAKEQKRFKKVNNDN